MKKNIAYGSYNTSVAEKIDRHDIWRIRTDIKPYIDPMTEEEQGVSFIETEFNHKPSMAEVKDFVCSVINAQTDEKILSGFVWNGKNVWLSAENQMNWALAKCPAVFKIGEEFDGTPVYYRFDTQDEISAFYNACVLWKQLCLVDGWQKKDSIDWTPYEEALNEQV